MRPATDSAASRLSRTVFWTLLGASAVLHGLGCSRLQQFRQGDRPVLGVLGPDRSKTPDKAKDAATKANDAATSDEASAPVDAYAQALKDKKSQTDSTLLAGRDAQPKAKATTRSESFAALEQDQEFAPRPTASPGTAPADGSSPRVTLQPPVALDDQPVLAANAAADTPNHWQPRSPSGGDRDAPVRGVALARAEAEPAARTALTAETIVRDARAKLGTLSTYQVHLNRQERVGDKLLPVEDVLLSVRREPKAVRLEWPDGPHKGREVIYSASENGGLMQVNMADSLVPVPRLSLPPDSPLVMSNSRHPITEAGFDTIVQHLESAMELEKAGTPTKGTVKYAGLAQVDGLDHPCHKLVRVTPSGETWLVYVDPKTKLPALVEGNAADGSLLERYRFLDPKGDLPALSQADAFDVAKRWGQPKGLLSRLTRPSASPAKPAESEAVLR